MRVSGVFCVMKICRGSVSSFCVLDEKVCTRNSLGFEHKSGIMAGCERKKWPGLPRVWIKGSL